MDESASFQTGPNTDAADDDTTVRRVTEIYDVQFGKGAISSSEGVAEYGDLRIGYNLVKVMIESN